MAEAALERFERTSEGPFAGDVRGRTNSDPIHAVGSGEGESLGSHGCTGSSSRSTLTAPPPGRTT